MAKFSEIILNGKKNGKTLEEINKELEKIRMRGLLDLLLTIGLTKEVIL